jgi:hypothetical protein
MFGYNAQFKRCAIDGAKTLRVQRLSATTEVNDTITTSLIRQIILAYNKNALVVSLKKRMTVISKLQLVQSKTVPIDR